MIYFLKEAKKSKANTEKWNVKAEGKFIVKKTKLQGKGDPILQARPSQPCNPGVGDTDKWKPCLLLASVVAHSRMPDSVTPWTAACQASWLSPRVCSNLCPPSPWCNPTRPLSARYFFRGKGSKYWMERNVIYIAWNPLLGNMSVYCLNQTQRY